MNNILVYTNIQISHLKNLDNFWKNLHLEVKSKIFLEKRNEFFKLKNQNPSAELSALEMASFYNVLSNFYDLKEKGIISDEEFETKKDYLLKSSDISIEPLSTDSPLIKEILENNIPQNNNLLDESEFSNQFKYCTYCGAKLSIDSNFCSECGKPSE